MLRTVSARFVVGLRWEPLLGLEREAKEIRTLLTRREATHYGIYIGEMGARSVGLLHAEADAVPDKFCSLLALLGDYIKQRSFLFIQLHPEQPDKVILAAVRDDRPELDDIFDVSDAAAAVGQFLGSGGLSDTVVVASAEVAAVLPHLVINKLVALDEVLGEMSRREVSRFAIQPGKVRQSFRVKPIPGIIIFLVTILGALYYAWPAPEPTMLPVDALPTFQARLAKAFSSETARGGTAYARAVESLVRNVQVDVYGWRASTIACSLSQCTVVRQRQAGGNTTAMLRKLDNVTLDGLNNAVEIVPIVMPDESDDVMAISRGDFSVLAAARMQLLGDYGLTPQLDPAEPIVPVPRSLSTNDEVRVINRGGWSLSGDAAFLDSLTGLIARSRNMVIKSLRIDLKVIPPTFIAEGTYYVE